MNIIWLKTGPLHPLDTGGKIRTFNMLRALKCGHDITYVALCPPEVPEQVKRSSAEYSHRQVWIPWRETRKNSLRFGFEVIGNSLFSDLPYVIQKYQSAEMALALRELDATSPYDVMISDFLTPAANLFQDGWRPRGPTLLFEHNVEFLIWKRLAENALNLAKRAWFRGQWKRMREFERTTGARFDGIVGVSEADCGILRGDFGATNVLGAVPTGVDCNFFRPVELERRPPSLVFLGSMDWLPNVDAVMYFVEDILPLVRQKFPELGCTIVGRNPPVKVRQLEARGLGIRVTGTVDDVRPYLSDAAAMIVPLRVGSGTRIKIFEGMAMGIPVVSTRIGAEGLPVSHGENILLGDTPADFARHIASLFEQPALAGRIGAAGRTLVLECFSWETVTRVFESYCGKICESRRRRTNKNPHAG